jgi:radical SAM-linked protein
MTRHPEPRDVAPIVQRLRVRYAKRGRLRFTSHRDFQRVLERAVRRAGLPVAFSAGFSPHPKISYVGAAPTGAASEAEYVEIALTGPRMPAAVARALDEALPQGFDVLDVVEAGPGSLADRIDASHWQIAIPGVPPGVAAAAVEAFRAAPEVPVERILKTGRRVLDARAAVAALGVVTDSDPGGCAILDLVVRHVTPAVRPDDVLTGLRQVSDSFDAASPRFPLATRLAQGHLDESGRLADPLAPDRKHRTDRGDRDDPADPDSRGDQDARRRRDEHETSALR